MRRDVRGVHLARNERSPCPESVFTIPEQAFTFARNQCSAWAGIRNEEVRARRGEASEPTQDEGDSWEHRESMEAPGGVVNGDSAQDWR